MAAAGPRPIRGSATARHAGGRGTTLRQPVGPDTQRARWRRNSQSARAAEPRRRGRGRCCVRHGEQLIPALLHHRPAEELGPAVRLPARRLHFARAHLEHG
eukprot:scaffold19989_cov112-Isochrysis_galbana.AAC.6